MTIGELRRDTEEPGKRRVFKVSRRFSPVLIVVADDYAQVCASELVYFATDFATAAHDVPDSVEVDSSEELKGGSILVTVTQKLDGPADGNVPYYKERTSPARVAAGPSIYLKGTQ